MRKKIVAGNWKMNNSLDEGLKLTSEIVNILEDVRTDVTVVIAPPSVHLSSVSKLTKGSSISVAAQNCHEKDSGAYTGEISVPMIQSTGASHVIIGHSERRGYFKEGDELLAQKIDAVLRHGLTPIFCCGESLEIRESGKHEAYVCQQIENSLFHLDTEDFQKIVIAYEPIWAIGTGVTATSEQAQDMHKTIRTFLQRKYGQDIASNCSILYGGSCKPSNASELFGMEDVDGGLIGGASLASRDFVDIITAFP